jgi:sulfur-oxidizing protein SoxA
MRSWLGGWRSIWALWLGVSVSAGPEALATEMAPATAAAAHRGVSGFSFMSPSTQAMQRDDSLNPALLWVKEGEALWRLPSGALGRSCATCHEPAAAQMRDVAARYPAMDRLLQRPVDLTARINLCRERHLHAPPLEPESAELLSIAAYLSIQSRGLSISPSADPSLAPFRDRGAALYRQRMGQLDLACSSCHDALQGRRLGGSAIPPADAAPYPVYRLEWQTLGSLQRRIRNCMTGVRAEPLAYGAAELIELELFLAARARGIAKEAPGVRP